MSRAAAQYRPKTCETCGEEFTPTSGRQKWCNPDCRIDQVIRAAAEAEADQAAAVEPQVGARTVPEETIVAQVEAAVRLNGEALRGRRGWREPGWQFVAELKKLPEWHGIDVDEAEARCERGFGVLWRRGKGNGAELPFSACYSPDQSAWLKRRFRDADNRGWTCALGVVDSFTDLAKANPDEDFMDPLESFRRCWAKVGAEPSAFDAAEYRARHSGYQEADVFGRELAVPRRSKFRHFLAVAREMSRAAEDGVFHLPVRYWADRLETDRRTMGGWRQEAEALGFLELVERESGHGGHLAKAARYRWSGP